MNDTRTFSNIDLLVSESMELEIGEGAEWFVPLELSLEDIVDKILLNLPRNSFYITPDDSKGVVRITKTHKGDGMRTVSSLNEISKLMENRTTDETFAVAEEVNPMQFEELVSNIEESGDFTVLEYKPEDTPRTITILCR